VQPARAALLHRRQPNSPRHRPILSHKRR
jgi:hypothetical protein